ncbi:transcriptional regulator MalT [Phycisphaerae bacterium RAS1]|nr:transcriptional regulator MalT [Phycisphaerae bacterium RAS1]
MIALAPPLATNRHEAPLRLDEATWAHICLSLKIPRQQQRILSLVLQGLSDKEIAAELALRVPTVRTYLTRIYQRTGVADRVTLILRVFAIAQNYWRESCPRQR